MLELIENTLFPVFGIIWLGYLLKVKGVIEPGYVRPANRIVYYVAIPAMVLEALSKTSLMAAFNLRAVLSVVAAIGLLVPLAFGLAWLLRVPRRSTGTFLQSCFHGNIGYMAYAIAYYALGEKSFAPTAVLGSFMMICQNFLAVSVLMGCGRETVALKRPRRWTFLMQILQNPIILSVVAGIFCSAAGITFPGPIREALHILTGMAFPSALLLIGASLSFEALPAVFKEVLGIGALKLVALPALGYAFMHVTHVPHPILVAGMVLLAAPPATVTYVMAVQLGGDPELAATSVSLNTLFSALTYALYLSSMTG